MYVCMCVCIYIYAHVYYSVFNCADFPILCTSLLSHYPRDQTQRNKGAKRNYYYVQRKQINKGAKEKQRDQEQINKGAKEKQRNNPTTPRPRDQEQRSYWGQCVSHMLRHFLKETASGLGSLS